VETALVGEGAGANEGLRGGRRHVGDFGDETSSVGQAPKLLVGDAIDALLELEVGGDGQQVGVAASSP
jgi:hypothetical protein